ncbi:MAG: hypothetical protein NVSMB25_17120 [Thermoleophilaceae bacterium]
MGLFGRQKPSHVESRSGGLAGDAASMRATLSGIQAELDRRRRQREIDLRALVTDLLEGEIAAPTGDVRMLIESETDPREFYEREIAPSWDGLAEDQRAARLEGFLELAAMLESTGENGGLPPGMGMTVRTKTLLLAWAFDETYGYLARLARGNGTSV